MAIKPILFNTEMVRAILDGRKTCTRRVMKPQPKSMLCYTFAGNGCGTWGYPSLPTNELFGEEYKISDDVLKEYLAKRWKPPYHADDILYVRETWQRAGLVDDFDKVIDETEKYYYLAGPEKPCFDFFVDPKTGKHKEKMPWKPSIHMPKEAARIWLKVKDVRVERLKDMTNNDALKEGAEGTRCDHAGFKTFGCTDCMNTGWLEPPMIEFMQIWNSTIKKSDIDTYGWDANPYVWVIEFERCEKPESEA